MSRLETKDQRVVIIGMGDTGVLVATRLSRHFKVIGISTKPNLVSGQELGKRLADLGWWSRYYNTPLRRFKALAGIEIHHAKAERVDLANKWVAPSNNPLRGASIFPALVHGPVSQERLQPDLA